MRLVDADKLRYKHSLNTVNTTMPQSIPCITKDEINNAPTVEAIPKDQYKADLVAMLEEIESMFWKLTKNKYDMQILYEKADDFEADFNSFIQEKINALKE